MTLRTTTTAATSSPSFLSSSRLFGFVADFQSAELLLQLLLSNLFDISTTALPVRSGRDVVLDLFIARLAVELQC